MSDRTELTDLLVVDESGGRQSKLLLAFQDVLGMAVDSTNDYEEAFRYVDDKKYRTILAHANNPKILPFIAHVRKANLTTRVIVYIEEADNAVHDRELYLLHDKGEIKYIKIQSMSLHEVDPALKKAVRNPPVTQAIRQLRDFYAKQ